VIASYIGISLVGWCLPDKMSTGQNGSNRHTLRRLVLSQGPIIALVVSCMHMHMHVFACMQLMYISNLLL
jgi:hypothetical protein